MIENGDEEISNQEPKLRIPGEGDVISGSGLPTGKKFVVDKTEDRVSGVKRVSVHQLLPDGSFDVNSKEEEFLIVSNDCKVLDLEKMKFHNKMKKKFVKKGE